MSEQIVAERVLKETSRWTNLYPDQEDDAIRDIVRLRKALEDSQQEIERWENMSCEELLIEAIEGCGMGDVVYLLKHSDKIAALEGSE